MMSNFSNYNSQFSGQVPGQVFTKNGLKGVKYEKNRSVSILYPIDYQ
jgi:hypothetical protein